MSLPESGSNSAVLFGHSGLATVAAEESAGTVKAGASAATEARTWKRNRRFLMAVLPAPTCNCGEMRTLQAGVVTLRRGRKTRNGDRNTPATRREVRARDTRSSAIPSFPGHARHPETYSKTCNRRRLLTSTTT